MIGKLLIAGVIIGSLKIWRGAGHSRHDGVNLWRLLRDSTHLTPDSPFGHPHLLYRDAVDQAQAAYREYYYNQCGRYP